MSWAWSTFSRWDLTTHGTSEIRTCRQGLTLRLTQVLMFHQHACECISEEYLLELADWCNRRLRYLNTDAHKHAMVKGDTLRGETFINHN